MSSRRSHSLILCMDNGSAITAPAIKHRARRMWVHGTIRKRQKYGEYHRLIQELLLEEARFQAYFRLTKGQFELLLRRVGGNISRAHTTIRETISPTERLCICASAHGEFTACSALLKLADLWSMRGPHHLLDKLALTSVFAVYGFKLIKYMLLLAVISPIELPCFAWLLSVYSVIAYCITELLLLLLLLLLGGKANFTRLLQQVLL